MAFVDNLYDIANKAKQREKEEMEAYRDAIFKKDLSDMHRAVKERAIYFAKGSKHNLCGYIVAYEDNYVDSKRELTFAFRGDGIRKRGIHDDSYIKQCVGNDEYCDRLINGILPILTAEGFKNISLEKEPVFETYVEQVRHVFKADEYISRKTDHLFGYIIKISVAW